ncbi:group-specific protein [Brevibacillus porteri]|uniref:Group-specific protein n=1 Tax=Brevibacillus porteri TaxID=2126350 RepID=A0ABX5FHS6_9BACL|nr:group-specific protein [Brevibacillus porteri]MED1801750.1 group-specific protein [Brevibacillus porteri]MED2134881.1 group-specific protein [Brevibacillus porteri]MED2748388.1 group-specific protein [Brevibacillus porteri]MED2818313.1 group-specific protein [Brevibacillus porteri]MED2897729.1 group-specific protein [Brevibacillus porteri]
MFRIEIDEDEVVKLIRERISELVNEVEAEQVFWDRKDLIRNTKMSWPTILNQFFYDQRFPKYKVGSKWYFPARDARAFLEKWVYEQK